MPRPKSKLSRMQREHPQKQRLGEMNGMAKLRAKQVLAIRRDSRSQETIAAAFGVDQATISDVRRGKTWVWLTG
jgi:hypothetical protein